MNNLERELRLLDLTLTEKKEVEEIERFIQFRNSLKRQLIDVESELQSVVEDETEDLIAFTSTANIYRVNELYRLKKNLKKEYKRINKKIGEICNRPIKNLTD